MEEEDLIIKVGLKLKNFEILKILKERPLSKSSILMLAKDIKTNKKVCLKAIHKYH